MTDVYAADRAVVGGLLSSWTATTLYLPNERFVFPEPSGDPANPVFVLAVEIEYESAELATFGGTREIRGTVLLGLWTEEGANDGRLLELADDLVGIFAHVSSGGIQFDEPVLGAGEVHEPWYGRPLRVPFVRFDG